MIERPISFDSEMVRAILTGRKKQTRCLLKNDPIGEPGDRLWVQESFYLYLEDGVNLEEVDIKNGQGLNISYPSDGLILYLTEAGIATDAASKSSHMPRWASRITLEINSIQKQRLNDISEDEIMKEGCPTSEFNKFMWFKNLWESIHGQDAWYGNPWVWAIDFKRVKS
jgi:hypothetical protein